MATAVVMTSSQPMIASTGSSTDGVGELTGLGWLSNVTLSLAALEVDGEKLPSNKFQSTSTTMNHKCFSYSSALHTSSSLTSKKTPSKRSVKRESTNTSHVPKFNRYRSYSTSAVPTIQKIIGSESTTIDEVSSFLANVTGSGVQTWNEAKKALSRPPYSLDCYIALAIRSLKKSITSMKITDCLRTRIPFYAKQSPDTLLLSVNRSLKRNACFVENLSGNWTCTAITPKRSSSTPTKSTHQRKRTNSFKKDTIDPAKKRKAPKPRSKSLSALSIPPNMLSHLQSKAHAAKMCNNNNNNNINSHNTTNNNNNNNHDDNSHHHGFNSIDLSDAGIFLDESILFNFKDTLSNFRSTPIPMDTTSISSDSAFASDSEQLDICNVEMNTLVPSITSDNTNTTDSNSLLFSTFEEDDQSRIGWMPTTYIPGLLTDNLFDGPVDFSPTSLTTIS